MGSGIARTALQAGYRVALYDMREAIAAKGATKVAEKRPAAFAGK
jgi:3-hydroxyacyl-CoA dehydrogenase